MKATIEAMPDARRTLSLRRLETLCNLLLHGRPFGARELFRMSRLSRYRPVSTTILGPPLIVPDAHSFIPMYLDIFEREIYRFRTGQPDPLILDGGANIGLSALYFKRLIPRARVIAFEADPTLARLLHANLSSFQVDDVRVVNAALASREGTIDFLAEGADSGRIAVPGDDASQIVQVPAVRLAGYLDQPVALLKLDIEGAETDVLRDSAGRLGQVERIFVEYHSFQALRQRLDELLGLLTDAGFRYQVLPAGTPPEQPFTRQPPDYEMDLQLNIFADRR